MGSIVRRMGIRALTSAGSIGPKVNKCSSVASNVPSPCGVTALTKVLMTYRMA